MDPTLRTRILTSLKQEMTALPRGLAKAAKYVIDHPSDFGLDPIRDTAHKSGVSTYTLVRLAERLGFQSFDALRAPFRQALVSSTVTLDAPGWLDSLRDAGDLGRVQAEAGLNEMAIVQRTLERQSADQMNRVVTMLHQAPQVYLTGARASFGLAHHLHYVGRMALPVLHLIPRHMNNPIDDLHMAQPGDVLVAITFTPYSRETIEACLFAQEKGLGLILISDSEVISADVQADETLMASMQSPYLFGCYAGAFALIETLIALLVAAGGDDALARIQSYEALRDTHHAYWDAPKKR